MHCMLSQKDARLHRSAPLHRPMAPAPATLPLSHRTHRLGQAGVEELVGDAAVVARRPAEAGGRAVEAGGREHRAVEERLGGRAGADAPDAKDGELVEGEVEAEEVDCGR